MNNLLFRLAAVPGAAAFVEAYWATGDHTAVLALCDWVDESRPEYAAAASALRSLVLPPPPREKPCTKTRRARSGRSRKPSAT
jgi:hypothetical protein